MKLAKPKITPRMQAFLSNALPQRPFWDICCDHGYVSYAAILSNEFSEIHCVDQVPHIIVRLKQLFIERLGNDQENIFYHEINAENLDKIVLGNCLIAGVGGLTIKNILSSLLGTQLLKADRLMLSPHTDEKVMLSYVESEDFKKYYHLVKKIIIIEGPRGRPLYIFDRQSLSV